MLLLLSEEFGKNKKKEVKLFVSYWRERDQISREFQSYRCSCILTNMLKILKEEEKCNENKNKIVEFDG